MREQPTIVVVGAESERLDAVTMRLERAGYDVHGCLGADAGMIAITDLEDVDAMVLGGPEVHENCRRLTRHLKRRHPYAYVLMPDGPLQAVVAVAAAFEGHAN